MAYRRERPRRRGLGCLGCLVAIVWILLMGGLVYHYFFRQQVSEFIGRQLGQQLQEQSERQTERLQEGAEGVLPTAVAALPPGELRITEQQANAFLAANADQLQPIDSVTVHFVPDQVQADIQALGTTSQARMGLAVQNGRIIAVDPQIDGPLGQVVSATDLARSFEQQINNQLAAQGRHVTDVRVEQGALTITIAE